MFNKRLKEAYRRVFGTGETFQPDIDLVMYDLMSRMYVNKPINGNDIQRAEKEGMRKVGIHLNNMMSLPLSHFIELDARVEKEAKKQSKAFSI